MYGIPQSKRKSGAYEEALAGYEAIAENYPDEVQPYLEMIDILLVDLNDPDRAHGVYQRGYLRLRKEEDREALARVYCAMRTRTDREPAAGRRTPIQRSAHRTPTETPMPEGGRNGSSTA
jgi:hypothetical protein